MQINTIHQLSLANVICFGGPGDESIGFYYTQAPANSFLSREIYS